MEGDFLNMSRMSSLHVSVTILILTTNDKDVRYDYS